MSGLIHSQPPEICIELPIVIELIKDSEAKKIQDSIIVALIRIGHYNDSIQAAQQKQIVNFSSALASRTTEVNEFGFKIQDLERKVTNKNRWIEGLGLGCLSLGGILFFAVR